MKDDRGMIKWAPYSSLVEQASSLAKMRYRKSKIEKPRVSGDQAEKINDILGEYHGERIVAKYWEDGYLFYLEGTIAKISVGDRFLQVGAKKIPFSSLIDLSESD